MRILYLHRTQGQGVEGVHIRGMVDAMREAGHEVVILGPPGTAPYGPSPEVVTRGLSARFARYAPELLFEFAEMAYDKRLKTRLTGLGSTYSPDLLYERFAFNARAGVDFARRRGIPAILEINYTSGDPLVRKRSGLLAPISRRSETRNFLGATLLATVSSRLMEQALKRGAPRDHVVLTPNAVSRDWWEEAENIEAKALPPSFGDEPVVGFVGGFYPWHGVDRLVEAFRRCREVGLPGSMVLVGDGPERPRIEAQIASSGLGRSVLLTGEVEHGTLPAWIAAMDICVMPHSNDYGSPMKIFEYMGMGRAVLAPDLPPLRDVIADGVNGRLFSSIQHPDPVTPLQEGLAELLADHTLRSGLAAAGRASVGERHTWRENWRRIEEALGRAKASLGSARGRGGD
jgi:glycosyltransferase involved in cell wall biosynthesis